MDSTTVPGLRIREAVKQDTAVILALITELAEYENLAHEVTATQGQLEEALFGARPFAEVMIAEYEGAAMEAPSGSVTPLMIRSIAGSPV